MGNWTKDSTTPTVGWVLSQFNKPNTTDNRTALTSNTSVGATISNAIVNVIAANTAIVSANVHVNTLGWGVATVGTGGRAGRIHFEPLVAFSSDFINTQQTADYPGEYAVGVTFT